METINFSQVYMEWKYFHNIWAISQKIKVTIGICQFKFLPMPLHLMHNAFVIFNSILITILTIKSVCLYVCSGVVTFLKLGVPQLSRAHFAIKNCPCPHRSLHLSGPKTARARARGAHKVTTPLRRKRCHFVSIGHHRAVHHYFDKHVCLSISTFVRCASTMKNITFGSPLDPQEPAGHPWRIHGVKPKVTLYIKCNLLSSSVSNIWAILSPKPWGEQSWTDLSLV